MNASQDLLFLINHLEDEFRTAQQVRIRPVFKSGTQRAPDLEQDYDPESNDLHQVSGVRVMTRRKEFFFPESWVRVSGQREIKKQIDEIWESLETH